MGHWYTKEYVTAGVLTGVRVGAVALGIPAIVNKDQALFITAVVLYGFTYLFDVIDAPFAVDRYNERLDSGETSFWFDLGPQNQATVGLLYENRF
jgi:hypothetical protein